MRGHLSVWGFVECADCDATLNPHEPFRRDAIRAIERAGWRWVRDLWRCPTCAAKALARSGR